MTTDPDSIAAVSLPEALTAYRQAAEALRVARLAFLRTGAQNGAAADVAMTADSALEELGQLVSLVNVEAQDIVQRCGLMFRSVADAEEQRLNVALARGQARAISSCPCGLCPTCVEAARVRSAGADPVEHFFAAILQAHAEQWAALVAQRRADAAPGLVAADGRPLAASGPRLVSADGFPIGATPNRVERRGAKQRPS